MYHYQNQDNFPIVNKIYQKTFQFNLDYSNIQTQNKKPSNKDSYKFYDYKIKPIPSLSYKNKNQLYFSFIFSNQQLYITVDGDIIIQNLYTNHLPTNKLLYYGSRNQISLFANIQLNYLNQRENLRNPPMTNITILKMNLSNKKSTLSTQISFSSDRNSSQYVDFIYGSALNTKCYILSTINGQIDFYSSSNGKLQLSKKISNSSLNLQKIGSSYLAYSQKEIFLINSISKSHFNVKSCSMPYEPFQEILLDDSENKLFYIKTINKLYTFQIFPICKPIQSYNIPQKSVLFLVRNLIFVFIQNRSLYYYINKTDHKIYNFQIPSSKCEKQSNITNSFQKFFIMKKNYDYYIICRVCIFQKVLSNSYTKTKILVDSEYLSIQFEQPFEDDFDYSQIRIPLIFCSFAFVIYISVKRNKSNPQEKRKKKQHQQMIQKQCQKLIEQLKTDHSKDQDKKDNLQQKKQK